MSSPSPMINSFGKNDIYLIFISFLLICNIGCGNTNRSSLILKSRPIIKEKAENSILQAEKMRESKQATVLYKPFQRVGKDWTRTQEVFKFFEGRLFVTATMLAPECEAARTLKHYQDLSLSKEEALELLEERLNYLNNNYLVFVAVSTSDIPKIQGPRATLGLVGSKGKKEDEIAVRLIIDGKRFTPSIVDSVSFKRGQVLANDFPYMTPVKSGYWLHFKVPQEYSFHKLIDQPHHLALRFSSLYGSTTLEWKTIIE